MSLYCYLLMRQLGYCIVVMYIVNIAIKTVANYIFIFIFLTPVDEL
jgi:hypothetical protein